MKQDIEKNIFKPFKENGKDYTLVAEYGIRTTNWTYFYATCSTYRIKVTKETVESKGDYMISFGQATEEDFPELLDIINIAGSDINGIPLHSVENGFYYLSNREKETTIKHFRIDEKQYDQLVKRCGTKEKLVEWIETQKPRWKKEAQNVIKKYELK